MKNSSETQHHRSETKRKEEKKIEKKKKKEAGSSGNSSQWNIAGNFSTLNDFAMIANFRYDREKYCAEQKFQFSLCLYLLL